MSEYVQSRKGPAVHILDKELVSYYRTLCHWLPHKRQAVRVTDPHVLPNCGECQVEDARRRGLA